MKNATRITMYCLCFWLIISLTACSIDLPTTVSPLTPLPGKLTLTPTRPTGTAIHAIQGAGHLSPMVGNRVADVRGVVTAVRNDGFYLQDPRPDQDPATSEAILVFTEVPPRVKPGDEILVTGTVDEFYPGGIASGNLSITEIISPTVKILRSGQPQPAPIVLGRGGRVPPSMRIKGDEKRFDAVENGLDYYESLESMRVQINQAVVVGPSTAYKEITVVADQGQDAGLRAMRGALVIRENDFNPERIILDDLLTILPEVNNGDSFREPLVGILDYSFGNFKVQLIKKPQVVRGNLVQATAPPAAIGEISIAALNLENLDPGDGHARFDRIAKMIVGHLLSPDILSVDEIQDNNGPTNDSMTDAGQTYQMLIDAIVANGGPTYAWRDIAPQSGEDGGEPGGNIRVGFLFHGAHGVQFVDRGKGNPLTAVKINAGPSGLQLSPSPGRISPTNPAFNGSRKPLVGEFVVGGQSLFIIGVHLNSKGSDSPLFGRYQPPVLSSEKQRIQQAEQIHAWSEQLLKLDPQANVVILGDFNDFQFSTALKTAAGESLQNLVMTLAEAERYSYVYEGNSQVLDQMLVSPAMANALRFYGAIHVNAEFAAGGRLSDHDPILARFFMPAQ